MRRSAAPLETCVPNLLYQILSFVLVVADRTCNKTLLSSKIFLPGLELLHSTKKHELTMNQEHAFPNMLLSDILPIGAIFKLMLDLYLCLETTPTSSFKIPRK